MKTGMIAAGLGLAVSGVASAAFTGYTVVSTNFTNSGYNLTRWEVFANFNGATDTVLNVFNFQAQGGWGAHLDAASGFWHKDNSDYSGGVLGQEYGTWAPQLTGSATTNRPFDSFLLIGGNPAAANTTNADPSWGLAGAGGWNQAQIPTTDLTNANAIGWFNSSPPNNQGRVGVAPNTATQVKLGQFILSQGDSAFRTYTLRTAYNNGTGGGVVFADGSFSLPAPGAIALLGLAGLAGRRRR
jgi:MYXO-CTERM domain-containing protein